MKRIFHIGIVVLAIGMPIMALATGATIGGDFGNSIYTLISQIKDSALILGASLLTVMLIYGAVVYIISFGNPARQNEATQIWLEAIGGYLLLLLAARVLTGTTFQSVTSPGSAAIEVTNVTALIPSPPLSSEKPNPIFKIVATVYDMYGEEDDKTEVSVNVDVGGAGQTVVRVNTNAPSGIAYISMPVNGQTTETITLGILDGYRLVEDDKSLFTDTDNDFAKEHFDGIKPEGSDQPYSNAEASNLGTSGTITFFIDSSQKTLYELTINLEKMPGKELMYKILDASGNNHPAVVPVGGGAIGGGPAGGAQNPNIMGIPGASLTDQTSERPPSFPNGVVYPLQTQVINIGRWKAGSEGSQIYVLGSNPGQPQKANVLIAMVPTEPDTQVTGWLLMYGLKSTSGSAATDTNQPPDQYQPPPDGGETENDNISADNCPYSYNSAIEDQATVGEAFSNEISKNTKNKACLFGELSNGDARTGDSCSEDYGGYGGGAVSIQMEDENPYVLCVYVRKAKQWAVQVDEPPLVKPAPKEGANAVAIIKRAESKMNLPGGVSLKIAEGPGNMFFNWWSKYQIHYDDTDTRWFRNVFKGADVHDLGAYGRLSVDFEGIDWSTKKSNWQILYYFPGSTNAQECTVQVGTSEDRTVIILPGAAPGNPAPQPQQQEPAAPLPVNGPIIWQGFQSFVLQLVNIARAAILSDEPGTGTPFNPQGDLIEITAPPYKDVSIDYTDNSSSGEVVFDGTPCFKPGALDFIFGNNGTCDFKVLKGTWVRVDFRSISPQGDLVALTTDALSAGSASIDSDGNPSGPFDACTGEPRVCPATDSTPEKTYDTAEQCASDCDTDCTAESTADQNQGGGETPSPDANVTWGNQPGSGSCWLDVEDNTNYYVKFASPTPSPSSSYD